MSRSLKSRTNFLTVPRMRPAVATTPAHVRVDCVMLFRLIIHVFCFFDTPRVSSRRRYLDPASVPKTSYPGLQAEFKLSLELGSILKQWVVIDYVSLACTPCTLESRVVTKVSGENRRDVFYHANKFRSSLAMEDTPTRKHRR